MEWWPTLGVHQTTSTQIAGDPTCSQMVTYTWCAPNFKHRGWPKMQPDGVMVTSTWCVPNYKFRGWSTVIGWLTSLFLLHVFLGVQYSLQSVQFFLLLIYFLSVGTHTHTPCQTTNHFQMRICHTALLEWLIHLNIHSLQWFFLFNFTTILSSKWSHSNIMTSE